MKTVKKLLPVIVFFLCINIISAQEMTAKKYDNLQWYNVVFVKFENGKLDAAKKIIDEHFKATDTELGYQGPAMELDLLYSEWDLMVVFPMEEGIEVLEWEISPRDVEWRKAFQTRVGSEEKAKEIQEEFGSYIKDYKSFLARRSGTP